MTSESAPASHHRSKSQLAYDEIKTRIVDGRYGPGHRLVLDQLAVSAVPVREAIRRLEAERLVQFAPRIGATVTAIDPVEYQHVMQSLAILEGAATALAAPLIGPAELDRAAEINDRMRRCLTEFDPAAFTELNHRFHEVLHGACPNPHLLDLVSRDWTRLAAIRRSTFVYVPGRAHASVEEHTRLLDLIGSRAEPDEIERFARRHRLATLEAFLTREPRR